MATAVKKTLAQLLGYEQQEKGRCLSAITAIDRAFQKPDLLDGHSKTYKPLDEEDKEILPPEFKKVQINAADSFKELREVCQTLWDMEATKDTSNCFAQADIILDGKVIVPAVQGTTLLFLHKRLEDLRTLITRTPTLDPANSWTWDRAVSLWKSEETKTHRTRKLETPLVLYHATKEHAAQTKTVMEDRIVGHYTSIKHSGALHLDSKRKLLDNLNRLDNAVMAAKERANMAELKEVKISEQLLNCLFDGVKLSFEEAETKS